MVCDVLTLANTGVRGLQPYQPGKPVEELERELGLQDVVKLASNENPLGPSSFALAAANKALADMHLYPDASGYLLKAALSEKLGVSSAQITLGNGSNEVLDLIARVFLDQASSAVFSQYAFIVYPIAVQAAGAKALVAPAQDWGHDLDAMLAAIADDTRLIFIANPNNPTGNYLPGDKIAAFLDAVPENIIVVLDEAYVEYVSEGDAVDGLQMLASYPNLIVTRTFSKAYGLAGLRLGYSISSPEIADLLNRVRAPFNVSVPAMAAGVAALNDDDYIEKSRLINTQGQQQLSAGLEALSIAYIPSMGNFICAQMPGPAMPYYQELLQRGVIVRPVGVYGMPNHLRISVGLPEQNERFLSALAQVLEQGPL